MTTQTPRPPRPAAYSVPSFVELKPTKRKFQKPKWTLKTDPASVAISGNKKTIFKMLESRLEKAALNDEQLRQELYKKCGCVLLNPHAYHYKDGTYTANDDNSEWYNADEVEMLKWLQQNTAHQC